MSGGGAPERVGVVGGGRMGAGIAHAFLMAGSQVAVVERDQASADAARERILHSIAVSVERGETAPDGDNLVVGIAWEALAGSQLVVEAVPELPELKAEALRHAEELLDPTAVLATNTSSLSIDALAASLRRPGGFAGMHFFNPVPASALVEVVAGSATAPSALTAVTGWVEAIGKTAIVVRDSPGFASSRLGVLLGLEAVRMIEEGVGSPEDIDRAMELGYRHPVGPLRLTDIVGLDVRLDIAEYLARELGPRFEPPELLRRMVAEGMLGRKSGRGFYAWPDARGTAASGPGRPR
ncbi:3-hydroxyacyl-CoA dehydrogenase family protein [Leifsonia aquatica]|uniref:3-hydroxybutyryl-CoA dehydrogenase n=2 Tax=Leifsonia aquatica TaxID=144185 RepID=A0A7W4V1D4_LEIAQ|nr:3-hydroxyacyl-CoA dehydrogenase family protein [Leifsonia aquatica]ERK71624.1 putative 3-hydroxybutyryl-CoA dehydrogenase [Leifsonia aquatica ATCC 14665]MBB2969391.1 3-hydroxybutyryl-CoA dehydrogenase [Leifsonia aquatica]